MVINPAPTTAYQGVTQGGRGPENNVCRVAPFLFLQYIARMLWRNSPRGRPINAPAAFIHPCQPSVAKQPPNRAWPGARAEADGYRLQIHVRDGRGLFNDTESRGGSQADMDCKID
jgi:hypothetical protein